MSLSPFEEAGALQIGVVEFASPDEIKVALHVETPTSVALNSGTPQPFPRVNGYLLVSVDDGFLAGQVEWIRIDRAPFPKRRGMQDFGLVDLPYPLRTLRLNPLGTLKDTSFTRGADALPSVGAMVLLPTEAQLRAIVESGEKRPVTVGASPLAGDAQVSVDPDRLFGRHLAVLGNTGSGKSCSVAGLIRWSLEAALASSPQSLNARFVILDPNGEYSRAFQTTPDAINVSVFSVDPQAEEHPLHVPLWFWNTAEWASLMQASPGTQQPLLRRALRDVKEGRTRPGPLTPEENKLNLRRRLASYLTILQGSLHSGAIKTDESKFGFRLKAILEDLEEHRVDYPDVDLGNLIDVIRYVHDKAHNSFEKAGELVEYYRAFPETRLAEAITVLEDILELLGAAAVLSGIGEDNPTHFNGDILVEYLEFLSNQEGMSQYLDPLINRMRTFLADPRVRELVVNTGDLSLDQWLESIMGEDSCITIIDLSLVPVEIVHIITAVIARLMLEALQRHVKLTHSELPTVLIVEEAHTFVKDYQRNTETPSAAVVCCQIFERIAREGRKFGLGLVLSSQRPSELSPTVLSQCNSFLLHRISNDSDQNLVQRLVPDNLRGLFRELPSLPSQTAILLGWATELPVLVKMRELPREHQPRSEDPDFWRAWTDGERSSDWARVVSDWTAGPATMLQPDTASQGEAPAGPQ